MTPADINKKFLGQQCTDRNTGFKGICDSVTYFLNGCVRASIQPRVDKDGKLLDSKWFDIQQIEVEAGEAGEAGEEVDTKSATGGPQGHDVPAGMSRD